MDESNGKINIIEKDYSIYFQKFDTNKEIRFTKEAAKMICKHALKYSI